jgi:hypothetical protein
MSYAVGCQILENRREVTVFNLMAHMLIIY